MTFIETWSKIRYKNAKIIYKYAKNVPIEQNQKVQISKKRGSDMLYQ